MCIRDSRALRYSLKDYLPLILALVMFQPTMPDKKHDSIDRIVNEIVLHSIK